VAAPQSPWPQLHDQLLELDLRLQAWVKCELPASEVEHHSTGNN
jgi:hypothetical protein